MLNFSWLDVSNLLVFLIVLPLIGIFLLLFVPTSNHSLLKLIALNTSCFLYVVSLFLWFFFNKSIGSFQFVSKLLWIFFLSFFYFRFIVVLYLFWKYTNSNAGVWDSKKRKFDSIERTSFLFTKPKLRQLWLIVCPVWFSLQTN